MLCGDLRSIEWLEQNLEGIDKVIYKKIRNKYPQTGSILTAVEICTVLSYNENPVIPNAANSVLSIKVADAINLRIDQQCALVCENLTDCAFYKLIAQHYIQSQKIKGISMSFHEELGGGNTICEVYQKCVEQDKILSLCLVDSDIKYGKTEKYPSNPARGDTVRMLEKVHNKLLKSSIATIFDLHTIPVHEVENLIPLSVLRLMASLDSPEIKDGVAYLEKLKAYRLTDAILCYDFKHGSKKIKTDPAVTYWIEIAEKTADDSLPALCEKVLEKAISALTSNTQSSIQDVTLDDYLVDIWKNIGLKVFSWGCASKQMQA